MRTRMYGGVRGRKTKVGGKPTFVFLLLDFSKYSHSASPLSCCKYTHYENSLFVREGVAIFELPCCKFIYACMSVCFSWIQES